MSTVNVNELRRIIKQQTRISMEKLGLEIMNYLKKLIDEYIYSTYTPFVYERTMELYDSMSIKVEETDDIIYLQVYIDNKIHSYNPTWRYKKPSTYPEIFEKFKEGFYGRDRGYDVVGDTEEEWINTGKAFEFIFKELSKKFKVLRF